MTTTIQLNNGVEMPLFGLGVFQVTDQAQCEETVCEALRIGYRMIDTAACYGNERAVGEAIRKSGVAREDVFISSKVWIQDAGYKKTKASFAKTLENLGTDYLDLYLIHMPFGDYHESWRAMEELVGAGKIRAIGVCNFMPDRLADLILSHQILPAVNQIELHPFCQQKKLRQLMDRYNIQPMAWAPFAEGQREIFTHPLLVEIGKAHQATAAQVILSWLRWQHIIAIPKSVHAERLAENYRSQDIQLTPEECQQIAALDDGQALILDLASVDEVYRLHDIRFEQ
ncbi:MAG: aldo/keto reductase [Peptococcaceae bacterium]|nr:aldo/keto reductase [Peptococcaceae bacterium]